MELAGAGIPHEVVHVQVPEENDRAILPELGGERVMSFGGEGGPGGVLPAGAVQKYVPQGYGLVHERQQFEVRARCPHYITDLDTVADMASFGVAPAFILMHAGLDGPVEMAAILVYICCAGTRLAYFNSIATKTTGPVAFFTGLPVTYAAMIFPLVLYFCYSPASGEVNALPLHITLWVVAFLFILRVPLPKPRGILYVIFPVLALALTWLWVQHM